MGRYHMKTTILLAASVLWSIGCNRDKDDGGEGLGEGDGTYEGLDAGDSDYDDTGAWEDWEDDEPIRGSISGTVTVELYIENDDGDREYLSMEEAYGTTFPFGAIWVGAYTSNENGVETYYGADTISYPTTSGDDYYIPIEMNMERDLWVYAVLDYWQDGIINTDDPIGVWPDEVRIEQGTNATDIDIVIVAEYQDFGGGTAGGGGGGGAGPGGDPDTDGDGTPDSSDDDDDGDGIPDVDDDDDDGDGIPDEYDDDDGWGDYGEWGGGTDCNDVDVSGPVTINEFVPVGADGMVMLTDTAGSEMIDASWFEAVATSDGASGQYGFDTCDNLGEMNLIGAVDSDANLLIDPADSWGAYVSKPGEDGNPINIEDSDLDDYEVEIPIGDGSGLNIVPFVQLTGTVSVEDGAFDDLASGSSVYVAALKYRPNHDLTVSSLESIAYDYDLFEWPDLTGETVKDWRLAVPSSTIVYLWAYVDEDVDGIINESGEPIASSGEDDAGTLSTGTANSDHTLTLVRVGE